MSVFPGAWVLPGGHLETNETLEQGICREIYEETSLNISPEDVTLFMMQEGTAGSEPMVT